MPGGSLNRFFLFLLLFAYPCANAQENTLLQTNGKGYLANFNSSTAMVIVFLVCAFFFMGFFSVYIRRCAEAATAESSPTGAPATVGSSCQKGLDQAVIESFPILVYSAVKDLKIGKGALECAVCLSEFTEYETLRLLPKCDHVFHPDCIDAWLAAHVTCPFCRAKLEPDPNSEFKNLESSSRIEVGEVGNDAVAVTVDENQSGDSQAVVENQNRPARYAKLPRSHSTGHSLSQPGENTERYTLRLPEEVRTQLVSNKLRRSTSYDVVLPQVGSSRKGYRYGGGEGKASVDNQTGWFDPWVLFRTPLFLARGGSVIVKSPKSGRHGEGMFGETPSRSVKMPVGLSEC